MNPKIGNESEILTLGTRLRQGREAMGLTLQEASSRLHLPHQIVRRIECDDLDALGAPVFVLGYLKSYARLVGMAEMDVDHCIPDTITPPPLIATGTVPLSQRLLERYSRQSLYMVLTGIMVVPIVFLALGGHLSQGGRTATLDTPPTEIAAMTGAAMADLGDHQVYQGPLLRQSTADGDRRAVVASMLPAPRSSSRAVDGYGDSPSLTLNLNERSWVEVTVMGGARLEFGMLPAGTERHYPLHSELQVSIGNAKGARVTYNGELLDLSEVRRANVARFRVSSDGHVQPPSGD